MAARGKGHDGKGPDDRNGAITEAAATGNHSVPGNAGFTSSGAELEEGSAALSYLCMRDDGWLRVIPGEDGKVLFAKWKYTRGPHAGHYVMARVAAGDWTFAIRILYGKVIAVESGKMRPTLDTPWTD